MINREEIDKILKQVELLSPADQASLAHFILESLPEEPNGTKPFLEELVGIGRGDGTPPSDEQVKQWIHEHRMRKYG